MRVVSQVWWLPKDGNAPEEYEDAFCPEHTNEEADTFRLAVADGATEASFSREWAKLLVGAYYNGRLTSNGFWQTIRELQRQWLESVHANPLPWYAEEKLQMGAYSSLMGLTLYAPSGRWEALAIGDSCLFQIRNGRLILKWPLDNPAQFSNRPILLSTKQERNADLSWQQISNSGDWEKGDLFYLMTDAMAHWYLQAVKQRHYPRTVIPNFGRHDPSKKFLKWIADLRSSGQMRNDDVTLMRVSVA